MKRRRLKRSRKTRSRLRKKNPTTLMIRNPSGRKKRAKKRRPAKVRARRRAPAAARGGAAAAELARMSRSKKPISHAQLQALAKKDKEFGRALARYRRFHGRYPDEITLCDIPGVKTDWRYGVALGHAKAHEYEVPRSSGRSPGPPFRHAFGRGKNFTVTDPDGRNVYLAKKPGSKLRVTSRGIEG